jgi:hypothetical protein
MDSHTYYSNNLNQHINLFIDNCLRLGKFIYIANKFGVSQDDFLFDCSANIYLSGYCSGNYITKNKEVCLNAHEVAINVGIDEKVSISILETYTKKRSNCYLSIETKTELPRALLEMTNFKPSPYHRESMTFCYIPLNKELFLPQYDSLPLYINVPFMKEYARHMFKVVPPPPISFKPLKFFI